MSLPADYLHPLNPLNSSIRQWPFYYSRAVDIYSKATQIRLRHPGNVLSRLVAGGEFASQCHRRYALRHLPRALSLRL